LTESGQPLKQSQLIDHFQLQESEFEGLRRRLRAMERDGQIIRNRRDGYGVAKKMDLICGRVIGHPDGFGFVVPEDGSDDLYISAKRMRGMLHGDKVLVRVAGIDHRGRREGAPVEVLERANKHVVGRVQKEHGICFVIPSNNRIAQDILVPPEQDRGARHGQIVVVEIVEQPSWRSQPIGQVTEVLGDHMAPGMEIDIAIRSHDIPNQWPDEVLEATNLLHPEVLDEHKAGREDLRDVPLVTIDGEDSKDFDDAVYCEPHGNGWRLLVAIADVSHYVSPESVLDKEALNRGNSVYFPEYVVPMLPEVLSNGLCSLNPKVDRLCMVCEMIISANGSTRKARFFKGVMRSHARLTYKQVAGVLQFGDKQIRNELSELVPHLENLYDLYKVFAERRAKRGALDFDTTETRIIFGESRKIERIIPVERNDAHKLIEECMIAANVAAAKYLLEAEIPALYRVHTGPTEEKFTNLREFLAELGLRVGGKSQPEPRHYAKLIEEIQDRPDAHVISMVLLRSLSQAIYCPENKGHFGLAFDAYTHFTSPIRRYPDLMVHRALAHAIEKRKPETFSYSQNMVEEIGDHCSMTERRADDATRDVVDWLKCEYLVDKVGDEFGGRISAVTSFGIFVELDEMFVEGLVHVTALDNDYYHFDAAHHRLMGERTNHIFSLSDRVKVRVMRVNLDDKKVDFELIEHIAAKTQRALHPGRKKKVSKKQKGKKTSPRRKARSKKTTAKKSASKRRRSSGRRKQR
jgi:ribonuclease R